MKRYRGCSTDGLKPVIALWALLTTVNSESYQNATATSFIRYIQNPPQMGPISRRSDFSFFRDPIFSELTHQSNNSDKVMTVADYQRGKRGAIELGQIMRCATGCNPLAFKGYGCYCGFLGSGRPVDGIDKCCKMHDWCYTTTTCMDLQYHLPYFVPFKWKCNGGSPYCIPGNSRNNGRDSCSHQLCECDRQFSMCLKSFQCPKGQAVCPDDGARMAQNVFMGFGTGQGFQKPTYNEVERSRSRSQQPRVLSIFGIKIGK